MNDICYCTGTNCEIREEYLEKFANVEKQFRKSM